MNNIVYFNGEFIPEEQARLPISTHALHYGTGVFEGIRAYYNQSEDCLIIFRLRDHFLRMEKNAAILSMSLPENIEKLCDITQELVQKNFTTEDLYIRPLAYKKDRAIGNFDLKKVGDGFFIYTVPLGRHFKGEKGIAAMLSGWERVSDRAIPPRGKVTGAYANTCLAKTESAEKGYDEAILLNQNGHISEASSENIFIVKNGNIYTPPVSDDILEGITRNTVITLIQKEINKEVSEKSLAKEDLRGADEIFLTGTGAEITAVTSVDRKQIGDGNVGPVSQKIREVYNTLVHGNYDGFGEWLTKVTR